MKKKTNKPDLRKIIEELDAQIKILQSDVERLENKNKQLEERIKKQENKPDHVPYPIPNPIDPYSPFKPRKPWRNPTDPWIIPEDDSDKYSPIPKPNTPPWRPMWCGSDQMM